MSFNRNHFSFYSLPFCLYVNTNCVQYFANKLQTRTHTLHKQKEAKKHSETRGRKKCFRLFDPPRKNGLDIVRIIFFFYILRRQHETDTYNMYANSPKTINKLIHSFHLHLNKKTKTIRALDSDTSDTVR